MKSTSEPAFTIVDKRGQNHTAEIVTPAPAAPELPKGKNAWQEINYLLAPVPNGPGSVLLFGRAVGLRSDGRVFVADYLLFPLVTSNTLDWRPHAKKRLETFTNCECDIAHGHCAVHKLYLPQWQQQDAERYGQLGMTQVPKALEILQKTEMAKRSNNIVVPR